MSLSKSQDRRINSSSSKFSVGVRQDLYTIGKDEVNKNKQNQLFQKCPVRYYVAFGLILFFNFWCYHCIACYCRVVNEDHYEK